MEFDAEIYCVINTSTAYDVKHPLQVNSYKYRDNAKFWSASEKLIHRVYTKNIVNIRNTNICSTHFLPRIV